MQGLNFFVPVLGSTVGKVRAEPVNFCRVDRVLSGGLRLEVKASRCFLVGYGRICRMPAVHSALAQLFAFSIGSERYRGHQRSLQIAFVLKVRLSS